MRNCKDCKSWVGPGINVDHAHCKEGRSPHQTTSKNGDKDYDTCLYWEKKYKFDQDEYHKFLTSFPGNFYKGGAGNPIGR
jgi:hypothetical protein